MSLLRKLFHSRCDYILEYRARLVEREMNIGFEWQRKFIDAENQIAELQQKIKELQQKAR